MNKKEHSFVLFGGDYNPDQWGEDTIEKDMELFKKAGVNTLTLPVFSWAKIEPKEGDYQFEWLDRILEKIQQNGMYFFLATPTCAQPAWMSAKYPEVLPVDIAGRKRTHGMRVFFCVNSEKYRERAAAIAKAMSERYKDYQGLLGWHVANEYGTYCYCENCQRKFRVWLMERYGNIEVLNEKWNTAFWGRSVATFEEIMLPTELNDDYRFNPAVELDYMRFVTDSTISCYENEAAILKRATPNLPVFTNISGYIKKLDQFKMVSKMDCAGWDNYPGPKDERSLPALKHDIMRGCKDGASFYVMEQSPNQQNWQPYNRLKRPGEIRRLAYQGLAHGSDSSLYFQMRQSVGGQEKFHGAMISHNGLGDTRVFKECSKIGEEFKKLEDTFVGARTKSEVGILFDWENWWALELSSGPSKDIDYLEQIHTYYKPFYNHNIAVDIIKMDTDFEPYKVIVAPLLYMMKGDVAERLEQFVKEGGTLIATYLTGYADENDRCIYGAYPGKLRKALGIWVEEVDALYPEERKTIRICGSDAMYLDEYKSMFLCDLIHLEGAEAIATYGDDFYENQPAITQNQFGKGRAYYLGTQMEDDFLEVFLHQLCKETGVLPLLESKGNLEITSRQNENGCFFFVINHGAEKGTVRLGEGNYRDILTGTILSGIVTINETDVMILQKL